MNQKKKKKSTKKYLTMNLIYLYTYYRLLTLSIDSIYIYYIYELVMNRPAITKYMCDVGALSGCFRCLLAGKKLFSCQLCGKVLCSKASLKRHIADKHAERQEEYKCGICERVYCSRNSLMTHIYTYHKSRPGEMDIKFF